MAHQSSSIAFSDDFTHSHGGGCYFVAVDPNFASDVTRASPPARRARAADTDPRLSPWQITEAAQLVARSRPEGERQAFVSSLSSAAQDAQPPAPEVAEDDELEVKRQRSPPSPKRPATRNGKSSSNSSTASSTTRLEATDKEFEGFSNLVLSFILALFPADHAEFASHVLTLADAISYSADRTANPFPLDPLRHPCHPLQLASFDFGLVEPAPPRRSPQTHFVRRPKRRFRRHPPRPQPVRIVPLVVGFGPGTQGEEEGNAAVSQSSRFWSRRANSPRRGRSSSRTCRPFGR